MRIVPSSEMRTRGGPKSRKTTSTGACKHGKTISKAGHCVCRTSARHQSAKTKARIRRKCG